MFLKISFIVVACAAFTLFALSAHAQQPESFSLERIYSEVVAPLQRENFDLRLRILSLTAERDALMARLAEFEKKESSK